MKNKNNDLAILLCTYNGEKYLQEQLDSYKAQTYKKWDLFVRDDQSKDTTGNIIAKFKDKNPKHFIDWHVNKKNLGFAGNFLNGIKTIPNSFKFYSFSDQDDVWFEKKLERAVNYLKKIPQNIPALYCARTMLADESCVEIGQSTLFCKPPSFSNALVQTIGGGNTMVFNNAAYKLITNIGSDVNVISHDWFIYQLITGADGKVFYDTEPCMLYRQHGSNLVGSNIGLFAKLTRLKKLLNNSFKDWTNRNYAALRKYDFLLSEENKQKLSLLEKSRNQWIIPRLIGFSKAGLYRQNFADQVALWLAILLNKV